MLGANALLQLKVWLLTISPMVCRRLLVRAGYSLRELHAALSKYDGLGRHPPLPVPQRRCRQRSVRLIVDNGAEKSA